jgi:hypothetical protein
MHGGNVEAKSEGGGKGATFTVGLSVRAVYIAETEGAPTTSGQEKPLARGWAIVVEMTPTRER